MSSTLDLRIASNRDGIAAAVDAAAAFLAGHAVPDETAQVVGIVMDELLANTTAYGHPGDDRAHAINLRLTVSPTELQLDVWDDGVAFDPLAATPPNTEAGIEERRIGGLGLMLVRELMDRVSYAREAGLNHVTTVKRLT